MPHEREKGFPLILNSKSRQYCLTRAEAIARIKRKLSNGWMSKELAQERALEITNDFQNKKIDRDSMKRYVF